MSEATFRAQMQGNLMANGVNAADANRIVDLAITAVEAAMQALNDALDAEPRLPIFTTATGLALQIACREFPVRFDKFKETAESHGARPVRVTTGPVQ